MFFFLFNISTFPFPKNTPLDTNPAVWKGQFSWQRCNWGLFQPREKVAKHYLDVKIVPHKNELENLAAAHTTVLLPGSAARWLWLYAWGTHCSRATWRGEEEILRAKCMISLLSNFRLRRWYSTLMQFHCQILCKTWLSTVFCFLNFRDCQIFTGP